VVGENRDVPFFRREGVVLNARCAWIVVGIAGRARRHCRSAVSKDRADIMCEVSCDMLCLSRAANDERCNKAVCHRNLIQ